MIPCLVRILVAVFLTNCNLLRVAFETPASKVINFSVTGNDNIGNDNTT